MRRLREAAAPHRAKIDQSEWPKQGEWTYEDYVRFTPDDNWGYQVLRGVLRMAPAPNLNHQRVSRRLFMRIAAFVEAQDLGEVFYAPVDVILPRKLAAPVQPDILFVSAERSDILKKNIIDGVPNLVIEVLSPSNWADDRQDKYEIYAAAGVPEYWIVDPEMQTIEVFTLGDGSYRLHGKFGPDDALTSIVLNGFRLAVNEVMP